MDLKLKKVGVVVLVTAITLGALVGIQFAWKKYMLDAPVTSKISNISGVSSVKIGTDSTDSGVIKVTLKSVPDLKVTCSQLLKAADSGKILLIDHRSPQLQSVLEQMRFNVEEALVKGDFVEMKAAIDKIAQTDKLTNYHIYMDDEYIYLQFGQGQNYLYQVFARQSDKAQLFTEG
ncbi:MAG: hypothetical protein M0Z55_06165 [Peptococcaceae bacterium]|nr:hypothetical protein [Peptococcaceae bacterium]